MNDVVDVDVLIVGAGLVGASLACALARLPLRVGMVEAALPAAGPGDARKLALAEASLVALGALGVLPRLRQAPTPIRRIHVSREGDFGAVDLQAREFGREALGGVVLAGDLQQALEARLTELPNLQRWRPARASASTLADGRREVAMVDAPALRTRLLACADGADSPLRKALGIGACVHDYGQQLFVCTLQAASPPDGTAFERFTAQGPCALLPMADGYGAVCGVAAADAPRVQALDDAGYLDYLQQRFGWRAGRLRTVGPRSAWPLRRVLAERLTAERAVLLGNAAQALHPIGAQGFNLGLRDALTLAEQLEGAADPGAAAVLTAYAEARREDRERTIAFSDGLARLTAGDTLLHRVGRSVGFAALNLDAGLRAQLALGAMGYRGQTPALLRRPA